MTRLRWDLIRFIGRPTEPASPKKKRSKGPWTHVKREPVKTYSAAERAKFGEQATGNGEASE
jgi:hypothetical protein